jgi:hypothetical protein
MFTANKIVPIPAPNEVILKMNEQDALILRMIIGAMTSSQIEDINRYSRNKVPNVNFDGWSISLYRTLSSVL